MRGCVPRSGASKGGTMLNTRTAAAPMLQRSEPPILYVGTPVVLISTCNEDGSANLAPMSSAFWLGWRGVLGLAAGSKTPQNMFRTRECVLNLPPADLVA